MKTSDFDFELPPELIAQYPAKRREDARLMSFERATGHIDHFHFTDFPNLLKEGDLLILNDTKVIPARLTAEKDTGKKFEILLLEATGLCQWKALVRPGKDAAKKIPLRLLDKNGRKTDICALVVGKEPEGGVYYVDFTRQGTPVDIRSELDNLGNIPLPPYIERKPEKDDVQRYQTVYAHYQGSVAAPTAGLHFTEIILNEIKKKGVQIATVTLHVGAGTFAPVKTENFEEHPMHEEPFLFSDETANAIRSAKLEHRRVIPVGTTSLRVIESVARQQKIYTEADLPRLHGTSMRTRLFIYPPAPFYFADAMLTNFHFPKSTLLMLVSAFASPNDVSGREKILVAYNQAIHEHYRFFSYGDAMFIH